MYLPFKRAFMALCLSLFCFVAFAQKTITGTVTDVTGDPLIGATVSLGGTNGVVTDYDGNFTLSNVKTGATLTVTYVGYQTKTVTVGSQNTYNIVLEANDKTLDEVVVVGYGTMKRRDLTGAVASVSGETLAKNPVANIAQALQGQLPGVSVISQDGRPGATMSIRVRGGGSITQSNDPLYVLAAVEANSGRQQEAIRCLNMILDRDPDDRDAKLALCVLGFSPVPFCRIPDDTRLLDELCAEPLRRGDPALRGPLCPP